MHLTNQRNTSLLPFGGERQQRVAALVGNGAQLGNVGFGVGKQIVRLLFDFVLAFERRTRLVFGVQRGAQLLRRRTVLAQRAFQLRNAVGETRHVRLERFDFRLAALDNVLGRLALDAIDVDVALLIKAIVVAKLCAACRAAAVAVEHGAEAHALRSGIAVGVAQRTTHAREHSAALLVAILGGRGARHEPVDGVVGLARRHTARAHRGVSQQRSGRSTATTGLSRQRALFVGIVARRASVVLVGRLRAERFADKRHASRLRCTLRRRTTKARQPDGVERHRESLRQSLAQQRFDAARTTAAADFIGRYGGQTHTYTHRRQREKARERA